MDCAFLASIDNDLRIAPPIALYVPLPSGDITQPHDFIAHYPNTFAAAAPLSGGGDTSTASIIKDIPIWAYHGVADTTVPVSDTDEMFDAIEAAGGNMEYTRLDGVGHGGWSNFYDGSTYKNSRGQTVYQRMFA